MMAKWDRAVGNVLRRTFNRQRVSLRWRKKTYSVVCEFHVGSVSRGHTDEVSGSGFQCHA